MWFTTGGWCLTKSDLEWKRNSKILVPTAALGGSSNAEKARVDSTTFNRTIQQEIGKQKLDAGLQKVGLSKA